LVASDSAWLWLLSARQPLAEERPGVRIIAADSNQEKKWGLLSLLTSCSKSRFTGAWLSVNRTHMLVTMYALAADAVLVLHLGFVLFVGLGGLLALRWPRIAWIHIPAAVWGAAIEFAGWICPLTPIENDLRARAGESPYTGDFIARYLLPVIYPEGLTRDAQMVLGLGVVLLNTAIYFIVFRRQRTREAQTSAPQD
jgi:hypothetical protein